MEANSFSPSLFSCCRIKTRQVLVGGVSIGGDAPIRVQSMTTTDTNDVEASVEQSLRIVDAGGELVRLTTQGVREAENIGLVRDELRKRGSNTPLVADIHFNANAAEVAAARVEAVRINPGNFTGEAKRFAADADKLSDAQWHALIVEKLTPLVNVCKEHKTAIRIGVNHGSLSDRIMAKFGDTPEGMVASCTEYLDAFEELGFQDIVISIKSSNTRVMVQTVRLLSAAMIARGVSYPLHLGVTEAGSDAEGRIKSAAGIGTLLADGLGDTIRVSLTEAPEAEIPVARKLVEHFESLRSVPAVPDCNLSSYSPFAYARRVSHDVCGIGGNNAPVVMAMTSAPTDAAEWCILPDTSMPSGFACVRSADGLAIPHVAIGHDPVPADGPIVAYVKPWELSDEVLEALRNRKDTIVSVLGMAKGHCVYSELRAAALRLSEAGVQAPLIATYFMEGDNKEDIQLSAAADLGGLFIDGLYDGLNIMVPEWPVADLIETADLLLQATRARFTRTEFISCPGCGRTLYNLQETVANIKARMGHLRGLKIGVMGCIVNGIGEMADADYGYVGAGRDKISLYRGKEVVCRNIPQESALDRLEEVIREDGKWL